MDDLVAYRVTATIDSYIREYVAQDEVKCVGKKRVDHSFLVVTNSGPHIVMSHAEESLRHRNPENIAVTRMEESVTLIEVRHK